MFTHCCTLCYVDCWLFNSNFLDIIETLTKLKYDKKVCLNGVIVGSNTRRMYTYFEKYVGGLEGFAGLNRLLPNIYSL